MSPKAKKQFPEWSQRLGQVDTNDASSRSHHLNLARAMVHAGLGDRYLDTLGPWKEMLSEGLTTWAEMPPPSRSRNLQQAELLKPVNSSNWLCSRTACPLF